MAKKIKLWKQAGKSSSNSNSNDSNNSGTTNNNNNNGGSGVGGSSSRSMSSPEQKYFNNFKELEKLRNSVYRKMSWWPNRLFLPDGERGLNLSARQANEHVSGRRGVGSSLPSTNGSGAKASSSRSQNGRDGNFSKATSSHQSQPNGTRKFNEHKIESRGTTGDTPGTNSSPGSDDISVGEAESFGCLLLEQIASSTTNSTQNVNGQASQQPHSAARLPSASGINRMTKGCTPISSKGVMMAKSPGGAFETTWSSSTNSSLASCTDSLDRSSESQGIPRVTDGMSSD